MPVMQSSRRRSHSQTHGVLQSEAEPGLGGNLDPLPFGEHLNGSPGAGAAGRADGRSSSATQNAAQNRADSSRAADHFTALSAAGTARSGNPLRGQVHHSTVDTDRNQV